MAHWLMKTEPDDYSWDRLVADGETEWTGVRNHQAAANMRAMRLGEQVFFYRSVVEPAILGIMTVSAEWYPDPADPDGKFVRVKVKPTGLCPRRGVAEGDQGRSTVRRSRPGPPVAPVGHAGRRRSTGGILCGMAGLK